MIEVVIYTDPFDDPVEIARVTIEGEVIGDSGTAEGIRHRLENERDPILSDYADGRELLRYSTASYSTGYTIAQYNSRESEHVIEELSDEEYEQWKETSEYNTEL